MFYFSSSKCRVVWRRRKWVFFYKVSQVRSKSLYNINILDTVVIINTVRAQNKIIQQMDTVINSHEDTFFYTYYQEKYLFSYMGLSAFYSVTHVRVRNTFMFI